MTADTLYYRDRVAMDPRNRLMETGETLASLLAGHATPIRLEPGDATRYDLVVMLLKGRMARMFHAEDGTLLLVTRCVGGDPMNSALIPAEGPITAHDVADLAGENMWTRELFQWYFSWLVEGLARAQ